MLLPDCLIIDITAPGGIRKIGEYICKIAYEGEPLGTTLDVDCHFARINGAAPFVRDGEFDMIELTVKDREKAPIIGLGTTRIAVGNHARHAAEWRALHDLRGKESILVPALEGEQWNLYEAPISRIRRHTAILPRFIPDAKPMLMSLYVDMGRTKSYWTPSGVLHV